LGVRISPSIESPVCRLKRRICEGETVDVVGAREVGGFRRAQEAEAVRQYLQRAVAEDRDPFLRQALEQREDQVLLAQPARVLDAVRDGHIDERRDVQHLQFGQMVGNGDTAVGGGCRCRNGGSRRLRGSGCTR